LGSHVRTLPGEGQSTHISIPSEVARGRAQLRSHPSPNHAHRVSIPSEVGRGRARRGTRCPRQVTAGVSIPSEMGLGRAQDDPPPVLEDPATFVSIPSEVGRGRALIECVRRVHETETKFQSPRRWDVVGLKSTRKSKETMNVSIPSDVGRGQARTSSTCRRPWNR